MNIMSFLEMNEYISKVSNDTLLIMCEEIYNWRYVKFELSLDSTLCRISREIKYPCIGEIEEAVVDEAHRRFKNIALLLVKDKPTYYFK